MRLVRVTRAAQLRTGDRVRCMINVHRVNDCKVYMHPNGSVYFCNNESACDGADCGEENRMGYDFSWAVPRVRGFSFDRRLSAESVSGLRKLVKEGT